MGEEVARQVSGENQDVSLSKRAFANLHLPRPISMSFILIVCQV